MKNERYTKKKTLSKTEMSTIYLAEDIKLKRLVAIKEINTEKINKEAKIRFKREIEILVKLEHPNIVPIYDYHVEENEIYYVMKFVEGESLKKIITSLPIESIIQIFIELLKVFSYIHKNRIIHRDIKPDNIIIDKIGTIYILDFGIAKLEELDITKLTKTKSYIGTLYYSSPEHFKGNNLNYTSDIYSLGIVLYEMLQGTIPFEGTLETVIHSHLYDTPPEITKIKHKVIKEICMKMLEKDPKNRFISCDEILKELKEKKLYLDANAYKKILNSQKRKKILFLFLIILVGLIIFYFRKPIKNSMIQFLQSYKSKTKKFSEPNPVPTDIPEKKENSKPIRDTIEMYVTDFLKLRSEPSIGSAVLNRIPFGTKIEVEKTKHTEKINEIFDHWYYVPKFNAYVFGSFLNYHIPEAKRKKFLLRSKNGQYKIYSKNIDILRSDIVFENEKFTEGSSKGTYLLRKTGIELYYSPEKRQFLCFSGGRFFQKCKKIK